MRRLTHDVIFESTGLSRDLVGKSVRGGVVTLTAQMIQIFLRTAGTMVLARLLTPADFGLIGMVAIVINFVAMFTDSGLSMATVQRDEINPAQISTLFWINVLISSILGLCVLAGSPLVAMFYGRPELTAITAVLSCSFIISGLSIQHTALLRRHMRFGTLAIIIIVSQVLYFVSTIMFAILGLSYWALVIGAMVSSVATVILTFLFCPWIPGRMKRGTGVRDMLMFGGNLTGFTFINFFSRNADKLLIGKYIGADALGFYDKAYQLFMLPISQIRGPITQVAMPVLSSLREQPERYIRYYRRLLDVLALLTIPISLYCLLEADFIIRLLLGPGWLDVIPLFQILAITGLVQPTMGTAGVVLLSLGHPGRLVMIATFTGTATILSFVIGVQFGTVGVATAYTAITYVLLFPRLFWYFHETPVSVRLFLSAHVSPALISILSAEVAVIVVMTWTNGSTLSHFSFLLVYTIVYTGLSFCQKSVRNIIVDILRSRFNQS